MPSIPRAGRIFFPARVHIALSSSNAVGQSGDPALPAGRATFVSSGGWIKFEKCLRDDPRVIRMARQLGNAGVTHERFTSKALVTLVLGGLTQLWCYADTHVREGDILDLGIDDIDEVVGIHGFASLIPDDWLEILDAEHVKLPGFVAHNGTEARKKALTQKRVARHRENSVTPERINNKESSNAPALPDQTRPDQDQTRSRERENSRASNADALQVHVEPRGPGVIPMGSAGTTINPSAAYEALMEDWKRDVPECNPDAFQRWIVALESLGKPMSVAMRLGQARLLAGNGGLPEQLEVVEYCISQGWKTLVPLRDVRARTRGISRQAEPKKPERTWRPPPDEPGAKTC